MRGESGRFYGRSLSDSEEFLKFGNLGPTEHVFIAMESRIENLERSQEGSATLAELVFHHGSVFFRRPCSGNHAKHFAQEVQGSIDLGWIESQGFLKLVEPKGLALHGQ